jgi:adenylate cyclase
MVDVERTFDWLVQGAPGARTPGDVVSRVATDLVEQGVPIERIEAFVRTLHPHIAGRTFLWTLDGGIVVTEKSYAFLHSPSFARSAAAEACRTGQRVRCRRADPASAQRDEIAHEGFSDFVAYPMTFLSGQVHAITCATRAEGGFDDAHVEAFGKLLAPLTRVGEIFALTRTAANLLSTYVGRNAGGRILAGNIQRGDVDSIRAVIWFSDVRGFTELAGSIEPAALIGVLNAVFDCQVFALERHGGEVLKFMGDGLLAIFPFEEHGRSMQELCDAALEAARASFAALELLNAARARDGAAPLRFGLSLHVGDVAFGNIGGSGRLDFTCIGPAVNVASRLEGLTSRLKRAVVVSEAFAKLTSWPMEGIGSFELKGVSAPENVFAPTDPLA